MNPLDPLSSFVEKQKEEEKDPNLKLYIFSSTSQVAAAASSSAKLAFATCFTATAATPHDHQGLNFHHVHQGEKSMAPSLVKSSVSEAEDQIRRKEDYKYSNNEASAKYWMSSKMRLMQKMMINTDKKLINIGGSNSDQKADTIRRNNNSNDDDEGRWSKIGVHNNGVRVCSDCNTTTTPLWRSGPQGPKSLCNACGIRQRKARRAMAEAANVGGAIVASEAVSGMELHKEKKSRLSCHGDGNAANNVAHVKNKCNNKIITADDVSSDSQSEGMNNNDNNNNNSNNNKNEVSLDGHNFTLRLSKSSTTGSAFGRVFPRDEEEAAILLMELSCGLLHTC